MRTKTGFSISQLLIVGLLFISINSCKKDEDSGSGNSIQQNSVVQNALKSAGITTYEGNTPPNLEGLYSTTPMKCYDASSRLSGFVGQNLNSIFKLYGQTASGSISFAEKLASGQFNSGNGCYVTGSGQNFTIWQSINISTGGATALIFSGTVGLSHDLISVKSLTVYTKASASYSVGDWYATRGTILRLDPPPVKAPTIVLNWVQVIPFSTVHLSAKVTDWGDYSASTVNIAGFFLNKDMKFTPITNDSFSIDVSDLAIGTYDCKAFMNVRDSWSPYAQPNYYSSVSTVSIVALGPTLKTDEVSNTSANSASCGGNVTSDGGYTITSKGVCWDSIANPSVKDNKTSDGNGIGSFTSNITGLKSNTKYYVRAYATTAQGTSYGNEVYFVTDATDIDGNVYKTIKIGNQVWMAENLKTTRYRNGDAIPNVKTGSEWVSLKTGAYCFYENNTSYKSTYGNLYNFFAVYDSRNLAPKGWHIPHISEWKTLIDFLDGANAAGGKMKEVGGAHWTDNYGQPAGGTNESGFTALPGGWCSDIFNALGHYGFWWTSDPNAQGSNMAWQYSLRYESTIIELYEMQQNTGLAVRCIKD